MPVSGFRVSSPEAFMNTEVSRLHAKLFRRLTASAPQYRLVDMRSTCGTYLNGDPIPVPDDLSGASEEDCARLLRSGDFFSLGPSAVNLFLFFQK
jgi:pSer/pThr/pTyr-binding forkhead associated (FHA) protein